MADLIRRIFGTTPEATAPWEPVRLARRIEADVLLLRAANDPLIPLDQMKRFRSVRPSTRFVELEAGGAHPWVHGSLSARGERVLRSTLAAFVDRAAAALSPVAPQRRGGTPVAPYVNSRGDARGLYRPRRMAPDGA